jgi:hypothetical protein
MIIINGQLDRLRSGYYPRIFYPFLYNVSERFFKAFESVFYMKPVTGGLLYRKSPEAWQQVATYYDPKAKKGKKIVLTSVVKTTMERPKYNDVAETLKREGARLSRGE